MELTLEEKIGQLFIVGIEGTEVTKEVEDYILKYKVGGFILYRKNFKDYESMLNLINKLNSINSKNKIPLFIAIDQEGGRVNRMPKEFANLPSAASIVKKNNEEYVKESADIIGKMLKESGINMNLAPDLDIRRFKNDNHAIGNRCYGTTKQEVIKNGILAMKEMQKNGIITVIKHFPGHGATKKDSHFLLPIINKSKKKLESEDIAVFKQAIKEGADIMMVGHLMVPNIDTLFPASLSKHFIQGYLKNKLNYKGIVMTDNLKMKSIKYMYGTVNAAVWAVKAGNDIVLMCFKKKQNLKIFRKIKEKIQRGNIDIARIDQSVEKILQIKDKYIKNVKAEGTDIEEINKRINKLRQICLGE